MTKQKSPFKFLDPYTLEDKELFFGREAEIDTLHDLVYETNLILIYGPSGTGKTSLIQCGLASRFQKTDWFDLYIRRRDNINYALLAEIRKNALTPISDDASVPTAVQSLFLDFFKPIYLIFDQFEELYLLGTHEERQTFIQTIADIVKADISCKMIIVMREEFIALLYDFEKIVPQLFDKRIRVEPMSFANVDKVIRGSASQFNIDLDDSENTVSLIIDKISDGKSGVQLSYLQVYLDRLYREANGE
jgi:AAA+ ATPase superfamily predicted ATPase